MNAFTKTQILSQIAQIHLMERGKLTMRTFNDRPPNAPAHFKLQSWENGKNHTRHVTAEQLPLLQEALAGFAQFQALTGQLAELLIADTRQQLLAIRAGAKKKTPRPSSSSPKSRKSSS
jgi:hypothetical protein